MRPRPVVEVAAEIAQLMITSESVSRDRADQLLRELDLAILSERAAVAPGATGVAPSDFELR